MKVVETNAFKTWAPLVVSAVGYIVGISIAWGASDAVNKEQDKKLEVIPNLIIRANDNMTKNVEQDTRIKKLEDRSELISAQFEEARRLLVLINERTDELLRRQRLEGK